MSLTKIQLLMMKKIVQIIIFCLSLNMAIHTFKFRFKSVYIGKSHFVPLNKNLVILKAQIKGTKLNILSLDFY